MCPAMILQKIQSTFKCQFCLFVHSYWHLRRHRNSHWHPHTSYRWLRTEVPAWSSTSLGVLVWRRDPKNPPQLSAPPYRSPASPLAQPPSAQPSTPQSTLPPFPRPSLLQRQFNLRRRQLCQRQPLFPPGMVPRHPVLLRSLPSSYPFPGRQAFHSARSRLRGLPVYLSVVRR